jgi:hypothetical protein
MCEQPLGQTTMGLIYVVRQQGPGVEGLLDSGFQSLGFQGPILGIWLGQTTLSLTYVMRAQGFRVQGSGSKVQGLGYRVQGSGPCTAGDV